MPIGQVRVSSGRFDDTKPPRTTAMKGEAGLYRAGLSEFGVVRPHRTSSNHCDAGETGLQGSFKWVWGGSTTPNLCKSVESRRTGKVQGGSTTPKLCESLESRPTGQVWVSSEWFVNTIPPRTTLLQGEAGPQGSFEWVLCGLTTPNLLEPLWWRGKKAYRAVTSQLRVVPPHQTSSNHCDAGGSRPRWQVRVWFRVVRPRWTSSNHCDAGGSMPTGQVRVSLGWFHHTEPPWTTMIQGEAGLQGSFEWVRGGSITPNLLEPLYCRGEQAYRAGSSEFWVVWPHWISSNHCTHVVGF